MSESAAQQSSGIGSRTKLGIGLVVVGFVLMAIAAVISQSIPYQENPLSKPTLVGCLFWAGLVLAIGPPWYAAARIIIDFIPRVIRLIKRSVYNNT